MKNIEGIIEGARKVIQSHCVDGGSGYSRLIHMGVQMQQIYGT